MRLRSLIACSIMIRCVATFRIPYRSLTRIDPVKLGQCRYNRGRALRAEASFDESELKRLVADASASMERNLASAPSPNVLEAQISDLERQTADPSFWTSPPSPEAQKVQSQLSQKQSLLERLNKWQQLDEECQAALSLLRELSASEEDQKDDIIMISEECKDLATSLLTDIQQYELQSLLSGPYDSKPARLLITAGAGGTEACDWVNMLSRMYTRHAQAMGFSITTQSSSPGDVTGYKSIEFLIQGADPSSNPYGWFKGEKGAHRLVRLSPYNANNKRQTTFAGVDVIPFLEDQDVHDIDVPDSQLEISFLRAGGKGGQNVNKVETGVRIKHTPTNIQVKCTQERSQHLNKGIALKLLKSQLLAIAQEQQLKNIQDIRGDVVEAGWGAQIRNYVLQPYKMVKDQRTGWETSNAQAFLDGEGLEDCIAELLHFQAQQQLISADEADAVTSST